MSENVSNTTDFSPPLIIFLRALSALIVGSFVILFTIPYLRLPDEIAFVVALAAFILALSWLLPAIKLPKQRPVAHYLPLILLAIGLVLVLPFSFMREAFGIGDLGSLLMTLTENRASDILASALRALP
ncbi:MAG: hypothetical protein R3D78_08800 [Paracoccaceae bacterium]